MRILISAGEASGEMYGAELINALRRLINSSSTPCLTNRDQGGVPQLDLSSQSVEFFGVGGEKMRAAGCDIIVDAHDLSVVGITEILSHLPKIWGLLHRLIAEADRRKPDLAVVIDSPAFNWRVAREMKKRGVPVVYYVCPQFWAWRQGRVRLLRKYVDKALVIFPFEQKFYRDHGVDADFVGHPLAELTRPEIPREEYAREHGLNPGKQWITLMPGSRRKEVRMNLPEMVRTAEILGPDYEFILPVAATLDFDFVHGLLNRHLKIADEGAPSGTKVAIRVVRNSLPALAHSRAGVVASGTATVEAALMGTPFVMVYRVTPMTYLLGRWTVKVPYFAMVNLIAGKPVVPELVQQDFTAERVASELKRVLVDGQERSEMVSGLGQVRELLGRHSGNGSAAESAAREILELLDHKLAGAGG